MKTANKVIYAIFGALALLYGGAALLSPATVVDEAARSGLVAHLLREQGASGVFIGLMAFWCVFNYERSRSVHYFLMVFTFLIAAIHWFDYFAGRIGGIGPIYNSVPLVILLVMVVFGRQGERSSVT